MCYMGTLLVVAPNSPRGHWPIGRVTRVIPSPDGVVRSVYVKTPTGEYYHPVSKLCLLESDVTDAPLLTTEVVSDLIFIAEGVYHRVAALHHSGFCRILNVRGSNCCLQTGSDTTTSIVDPYFPLALLSTHWKILLTSVEEEKLLAPWE
ncbi:hypothetical protein OUZ56_029791 [Daphnia magna]|uniref:DUF5641 domain-containing protein n=1 Tax=Daphnia magna TaxID=35525 RepID=A0ABR0B7V6_9CRUS|nr:hypothetical protein OUZ56_029791 [Daphnia magna]